MKEISVEKIRAEDYEFGREAAKGEKASKGDIWEDIDENENNKGLDNFKNFNKE